MTNELKKNQGNYTFHNSLKQYKISWANSKPSERRI